MSLACRVFDYQKELGTPSGVPYPETHLFFDGGRRILILELQDDQYSIQGRAQKSAVELVRDAEVFFAAHGQPASSIQSWTATGKMMPMQMPLEATRALSTSSLVHLISGNYLVSGTANSPQLERHGLVMPYGARLADYHWARMVTSETLSDSEIQVISESVERLIADRPSTLENWPPLIFRRNGL